MTVTAPDGRKAKALRLFAERFPVLRAFLVVPVTVVVLLIVIALIGPFHFGGAPSTMELINTLVVVAAVAFICGKFAASGLGPEPSLAEALPNVGIFFIVAAVLALLEYGIDGAPGWVRAGGELHWRAYALSTGASMAVGFAAGQEWQRLRAGSGARVQ